MGKSNAYMYMYIKIVMIKREKYYETFTKRVIGVVQKAKMLDHDAVCIINWPFIYDGRYRITHSGIAEFGKHRLILKTTKWNPPLNSQLWVWMSRVLGDQRITCVYTSKCVTLKLQYFIVMSTKYRHQQYLNVNQISSEGC